MTCSDCVPAVNSRTGEFMTGSGRRKARQILEKREGPPPFPGAVCRHLCENDSTVPNGFVCTLHTTWGTRSENEMDKSPETRASSASAAGKIGGRISVESGHLASIASKGGRIGGRIAVESGHLASIQSKGGKIWTSRPDNPNKVQVTCPHCGKIGQKFAMGRWHGDNCRHKPPN